MFQRPGRRAARAAMSRFSHTVSSAKMRRSSGTKPMPARAMRCGLQPAISAPFHSTRPLLRRTRPLTERVLGLLPPPVGPHKHTPSPPAAARAHEAHDRADRRRLADAVAPQQADALASGDIERDAEQDLAEAVGGVDVFEGE